MGGEEFVTLLPGAQAGEAMAYAERVREAFADDAGGELPAVTISAGVSAALAPVKVEELLHSADSALYAQLSGQDPTGKPSLPRRPSRNGCVLALASARLNSRLPNAS